MSRPEPLGHLAVDRALATGLVPDLVVREAARQAARKRLRRESRGGAEAAELRLAELIGRMSSGPVAEQVETANHQHYEVPTDFFRLFLGPRMKYSACWWPEGVEGLDQAEEATLDLCCRRAGIEDGMNLLDLGCGWGSMSLWMAERYPHASVTAVSNSRTQKQWIDAQASSRGLANLEVITSDVGQFEPGGRFDRIVSVEMFEHLRNWKELMRRISTWLEPGGRFFLHVFSNRLYGYRFTDGWFASRFFTAGTMPSHDLALFFQDDLIAEQRWLIDGTHYARTLEAWLDRLDARRAEARALLEPGGRGRFAAWRVFLMAAAETWAFRGGQEWVVSHYLFRTRD